MDSPADLLATSLAKNFGLWRTIDLKVRHELSALPIKKDLAFDHIITHYVASRAGLRYSDVTFMKGDVVTDRKANYYDGMKAAIVFFKKEDHQLQSWVQIKREFADEDRFGKLAIPSPIQFFYVARTPLYVALREAKYLGSGRVNGRECQNFLFPGVNYTVSKQDLVYSLDATTGTPLKVASYLDEPSRTQEIPIWSWTCNKLKTTQGHEIPVDSTVLGYKTGAHTVEFVHKYTVETIKFDQEYPAKTFWPVINPGVPIMDEILNKGIGLPGAIRQVPKSLTVEPPRTANQTRDMPASFPFLTMSLGLTLLFAGGILSWRRH